MFESLATFVAANRPIVDILQAVAAIVNLLGWLIGGTLLFRAWRRNQIKSVTVGPLSFQLEQAVAATAVASRDWQQRGGGGTTDVERIKETISKAFEPTVSAQMTGKSILWVDDNPGNNELPVRAIRKLGLDVEQRISTEDGLAAMGQRHFDLIISDMGRGSNMRAGYDLLEAVRRTRPTVPFLIFASADKPEFRKEAQQRGAQLSTNNMLELIDQIIKHLGNEKAG